MDRRRELSTALGELLAQTGTQQAALLLGCMLHHLASVGTLP